MPDALEVYQINWREPLQTVCGLVESRWGGIVRVFGTENCAPSSFLKVVRNRIRGLGAKDIKIDPADETTRAPWDIVAKLEDWLGIVTVMPEIRVGCDNIADIVRVEDVLIEVPLRHGIMRRCREITQRIKTGLSRSPFAILLWASDDVPEKTSRWLWGDLWDEHLAALAASGLLVIEWVHTANRIPEWAPAADARIQLPEVYSPQESADAELDIATLLRVEGSFNDEEAVLRSHTLLAAWENRPAKVYASLPAAIGILKSR